MYDCLLIICQNLFGARKKMAFIAFSYPIECKSYWVKKKNVTKKFNQGFFMSSCLFGQCMLDKWIINFLLTGHESSRLVTEPSLVVLLYIVLFRYIFLTILMHTFFGID